MPPSIPNPAKRFTANPARPVGRYRPGKAVAEHESSDEEESEEEKPKSKLPPRKPQASRPQLGRSQAQRQVESEDDDEEGFVTDEEDATDAKPPVKAPRPALISTDDIEQELEAEEDEDESTEESSEEEEESSEEEVVPQRKFQRPTFIKKSDRNLSSATPTPSIDALGTPAPDPEVETQSRRLAQAELMIKDKLERDLIARSQGKKEWDDDDDILPESMVDDTDDLDPEAEYAAWKLRELKRLKRDREALVAREKEIEEVDRRRNLTAEEREKEDKTYLEKQTAEREKNRGEASYMARYHHKGAFFLDDETAEILKKRDLMGARFEDQVSDKSALPEYMRIRDMTKLGKKGRTRYTDMKSEDTGHFGEDVKRWRGGGGGPGTGGRGGFDTRGVDERFLPDDQRGGGSMGPTGANASVVAPRREKVREKSGKEDAEQERESGRTSYRLEDNDKDHVRREDADPLRDQPRDRRKRSYSRSRSRSRSPRRQKRDYSYDRDSRDRDDYRRRDGVRA